MNNDINYIVTSKWYIKTKYQLYKHQLYKDQLYIKYQNKNANQNICDKNTTTKVKNPCFMAKWQRNYYMHHLQHTD